MKRLFWRIYFNGLLLLVAIALSVGGMLWLAGHSPFWHDLPEGLASSLASTVDRRDLEQLQGKLDELHRLIRAHLSVYSPEGDLLAWAGSKPLPALAPGEIDTVGRGEFFHDRSLSYLAVSIPTSGRDASAYLLVGWHRPHSPFYMLTILALILGVLALISIPLARGIARPLEKLRRTAAQLARGDLSARTGLVRKDEVGVLARAMDHMAERVGHQVRSQKELLANISHEIRTPLARIRVALSLGTEDLDKHADLETIKKHLNDMDADVDELDQLIEDVLSISRFDLAPGPDTALPLHRERLRMERVLDESAARFAERHPGHRLELLHRDDELPLFDADPKLLRRTLDNLLDNAAKYSPKEKSIEVSAEATGQHLQVRIRDRGIGVAEQDLDRLFEPFFRTDRSRKRQTGGIGLGLTLCKRIIEAHSGRIWAESLSDGTAFVFRLPV